MHNFRTYLPFPTLQRRKTQISVNSVCNVAEALEKCQLNWLSIRSVRTNRANFNLWRQVLFQNCYGRFVCEMRILGNADIVLICSVKKAIVRCVRNEHKTQILRLFQSNLVSSCDKESFELRFVNKCVCERKQTKKKTETNATIVFPTVENYVHKIMFSKNNAGIFCFTWIIWVGEFPVQ